MKQQQNGSDRAITAPLKGTHIQIIACAGSGKTETLARRVAHLLAERVEPESIVAFTFTEKAAAELKKRILDRSKQKCGQAVLGRIGRMYVGTIHAYALRLLQTYAPRYAGSFPDCTAARPSTGMPPASVPWHSGLQASSKRPC